MKLQSRTPLERNIQYYQYFNRNRQSCVAIVYHVPPAFFFFSPIKNSWLMESDMMDHPANERSPKTLPLNSSDHSS